MGSKYILARRKENSVFTWVGKLVHITKPKRICSNLKHGVEWIIVTNEDKVVILNDQDHDFTFIHSDDPRLVH